MIYQLEILLNLSKYHSVSDNLILSGKFFLNQLIQLMMMLEYQEEFIYQVVN